jgi:hypothetical protein
MSGTQDRKTIIIRPNEMQVGLYDVFSLKAIKGKVNNVYVWDDFVVFYADKDIMLFRAPPFLPPSQAIESPILEKSEISKNTQKTLLNEF